MRGDGTLTGDLVLAAVSLAGLGLTASSINGAVRQDVRPASAPIASVAEMSADVKRRPATTLVWDSLRAGDDVWRADAVFAGAGAQATLRFAAGSQIVIGERSLVVVDTPSGDDAGTPSVTVQAGAAVGHAGANGLVVSVGGVRAELGPSAEARVGESAGKQLTIMAQSGEVTLRDADGRQTPLPPSQTVSIAGARPSQPAALPARLTRPDDAGRVFLDGERASVSFEWQGAPQAKLQIAADRAFTRPLPIAAGAAQQLGAGTYYWRVVDAAGQALSEERWLTVTRDEAPAPIRPRRAEIIYLPPGLRTTFSWQELTGIARYHVEVSATATFEQLIRSADTESASYIFDSGGLAEGIYYWRARAMLPDRTPAFSEAIPFRLILEPLPQTPRLFDPELERAPARHP